MRGCTTVPFSILFADTLSTHGLSWTIDHYIRNGMQRWEVEFWLRSTRANYY